MIETCLYRHYKNKHYKYLGLVRHSETLEELALYETLYENNLGKTWVRPKELFFGKIEVNGQLIERFKPVEFHFEEIVKPTETQLKKYPELKLIGRVDLLQVVYDQGAAVAFKGGYAETNTNFKSSLTFVLAEYQKLGIGLNLTQQQHEWCRKNKFQKVTSKVSNNNQQMIRMNLKADLLITRIENGTELIFEKLLS